MSETMVRFDHLISPRWWDILRNNRPTRPVQTFHHITVTGTTEFHDYETFGSDEHGTFGFRQETTLSTNDIGSTLLSWRQGFGGEERVELDIDVVPCALMVFSL